MAEMNDYWSFDRAGTELGTQTAANKQGGLEPLSMVRSDLNYSTTSAKTKVIYLDDAKM